MVNKDESITKARSRPTGVGCYTFRQTRCWRVTFRTYRRPHAWARGGTCPPHPSENVVKCFVHQ